MDGLSATRGFFKPLVLGGYRQPLSFEAFYFGSEAGEFFFDMLVTTVEVVYSRYTRPAVGDQSGEYEGGASAQIGGHKARAA